jgi:hypothetical protein
MSSQLPPSQIFLLSLTHSILTHNNFFNSFHYVKVKGTAMGTRMTPFYANLFIRSLEKDFLNSEHSKPDLWFRFIDIFLLWTHGYDSLFLERPNITTLSDLLGPSTIPMSPFFILTYMLTS